MTSWQDVNGGHVCLVGGVRNKEGGQRVISLKVKEYLKTHFLKNQQKKFLFFIFTYFVKEVFNFF